jgi:hypothetical protein
MIRYYSRYSAGYYMEDDDWFNLEIAGWKVDWITKPGEPLAEFAWREGLSLEEAILEWKTITGGDPNEPGCSCCGSPHEFDEVPQEQKKA